MLNIHTGDISESKYRLAVLENREQERIQKEQQDDKNKKAQGDKSTVRDNIVVIDGIPEGEKSRGELTSKSYCCS